MSSQTVVLSSSTNPKANAIVRQIANNWPPCTVHSTGPMRTKPRTRFEEYALLCRKAGPYGSRTPAGRWARRNPYPAAKAVHASRPIQPITGPVKQEPNGLAVPIHDVPLPHAYQSARDSGVLAPWEDSITNSIPSHESIGHLSEFLYNEVVGRYIVDGPPETGTAVKVEAKIGRLVYQDTNTRIRLPVTGETVVNRDLGSRVNFKSSITQEQHLSSNGFLNKTFMASQKPKIDSASPTTTTPRIPMTYVHAHEIDTEYELSGASFLSLPWSIRAWLKSHHSRARVLVTTDEKTGAFIRGIIKVCLAHLDVYSPRTEFDYRVSINLEMPMGDEWRSMVAAAAATDVKPPHRNNDRLSFKHLLYQIDLSRFTSAGSNKTTETAHELSVTVSTAKVIGHGLLRCDSRRNEFEKVVRG
ncbi:mRNA-capping enzyme subunit beta, partial [Sticta canariensis]|nr:mRNA-capping enzyme subunit beta [Sticta canariensis]